MIPATMLGLAIGDAAGQPFEGYSSSKIAREDWDGSFRAGCFSVPLKAGQWTDDTKMALCIAQSLVDKKGFDLEDIACLYQNWVLSGDVRGIGVQTARSIYRMMDGEELKKCGRIELDKRINTQFDENLCGNGTVMRIAPLGLFFRYDLVKAIKYAKQESILTHDHKDAKDSSAAMAYMVASLANGMHPIDSVHEAIAILDDGNVKNKLKEAIKLNDASASLEASKSIGVKGGCAHDTLGSAVFCWLRFSGDGFKIPIVNAVKLGSDTDTRAAITGALVGTQLGLESISEEYYNVESFDLLKAFDQVLFAGPKQLENKK